MSTNKDTYDSEDMFEDTRMSFGDHLEELRTHLWRAIIGFLIAMCFSFFIGKFVLRIIAQPVEEQLTAFYERRGIEIGEELGKPLYEKYKRLQELQDLKAKGSLKSSEEKELAKLEKDQVLENYQRLIDLDSKETLTEDEKAEKQKLVGTSYEKLNQPIEQQMSFSAEDLGKQLGLDQAQLDKLKGRRIVTTIRTEEPLRAIVQQNHIIQLVTRRPALSTLSIQEAFMAYFKVCIGCGFVIGSPWIFYQIWLFIAAGLYPHEKKLVHVYLPVSLGLFLCGVVICQLFVIPKAIEALLWFNEWLGLEPNLRFDEWLGFAIMMPIVFGLSFQLPLVMMFLERIGILTVEMYKKQWKIAFFVIHVFAAIITPSVDIISMELLALPMFGLYWMGIIMCRMNPTRSGLEDIDVPESEDMVEV